MCSLNTPAFPHCLAVVDSATLTVGAIDEIQKLQVRKVPLGESPHRIAHQESSSTFCVLTSHEPRTPCEFKLLSTVLSTSALRVSLMCPASYRMGRCYRKFAILVNSLSGWPTSCCSTTDVCGDGHTRVHQVV